MITIKNRSDLDPNGRKLYSVEYEGQNYWVRPFGPSSYWNVIKDDVENGEYNLYNVRDRGHKFICTCAGSMHGKRGCRHIDIVRELLKQ